MNYNYITSHARNAFKTDLQPKHNPNNTSTIGHTQKEVAWAFSIGE